MAARVRENATIGPEPARALTEITDFRKESQAGMEPVSLLTLPLPFGAGRLGDRSGHRLGRGRRPRDEGSPRSGCGFAAIRVRRQARPQLGVVGLRCALRRTVRVGGKTSP